MNDPAKILIIEDDETIRLILNAVLTDAGYTVLEAADGVSGLLLAETASPDLAILDLHLPDFSGVDLAGCLHQRLPFLVLTKEAETESVRRCTDYGALGYLLKPLDVDSLLRQVSIALKRGWETLNLRAALENTQAISRALGLLMGLRRLSEETAYRHLIAFATARGRRLSEVARDLVEAYRQTLTADGPAGAVAPLSAKTAPDALELLGGPPTPAR